MEPLPFATPQDWSDWLANNHATAPEVWVKLYKKGTGIASITWEQGVIEALCWGWIDGQSKSFDDVAWLQRFTPRRKRSIWSQKNVGLVTDLIAAGRMQSAGMVHVDAARADGRWDAAYSGGGAAAAVPPDFLAALAADPAAEAFYMTLDGRQRYTIYFRLHTAKKHETRAKRMAQFLGMMARGDKFP